MITQSYNKIFIYAKQVMFYFIPFSDNASFFFSPLIESLSRNTGIYPLCIVNGCSVYK